MGDPAVYRLFGRTAGSFCVNLPGSEQLQKIDKLNTMFYNEIF